MSRNTEKFFEQAELENGCVESFDVSGERLCLVLFAERERAECAEDLARKGVSLDYIVAKGRICGRSDTVVIVDRGISDLGFSDRVKLVCKRDRAFGLSDAIESEALEVGVNCGRALGHVAHSERIRGIILVAESLLAFCDREIDRSLVDEIVLFFTIVFGEDKTCVKLFFCLFVLAVCDKLASDKVFEPSVMLGEIALAALVGVEAVSVKYIGRLFVVAANRAKNGVRERAVIAL